MTMHNVLHSLIPQNDSNAHFQVPLPRQGLAYSYGTNNSMPLLRPAHLIFPVIYAL